MSYAQHMHYAIRMRDYHALGLMSEADASLAVNREWHFMAKEHKALYGAINWWTSTLCPVAKGHPGGPMEVDQVEGSGETAEPIETEGDAETKEISVILEEDEDDVDEDDEKEN